MDKQQYALEANWQLQNTRCYRTISDSIQVATQTQVRNIIQSLHNRKYITAKQRDYLYGPDDPRPRGFYLLPKIHKKPETWTVPYEIPAGRPIVSDCNSVTYNVLIHWPLFGPPLHETLQLHQGHLSFFRDHLSHGGPLTHFFVHHRYWQLIYKYQYFYGSLRCKNYFPKVPWS